MILTLTCQTPIGDVPLDLCMEYVAGKPPILSGHPDSWSPAEPGWVRLHEVFVAGCGKVVPLDDLPKTFPSEGELYKLARLASEGGHGW